MLAETVDEGTYLKVKKNLKIKLKEPTTTATTSTAQYRPFYRAGGRAGMGWLEMVHHPDFEAKLKMGQKELTTTTTSTTTSTTTTEPVELLCE